MSGLTRQRRLTPQIAQVSADPYLATSREEILRRAGYEVQTFSAPSALAHACAKHTFDLLIVGHSLEYEGREQISRTFREHNAGSPILQLQKLAGNEGPTTAEFVFEVDEGPTSW